MNRLLKDVRYMDINDVKGIETETYWHVKINLIVCICKSMGLPDVFNKNLNLDCGRKTDILYGVLVEMLIANICSNHRPLYCLNHFYTDVDLENGFK